MVIMWAYLLFAATTALTAYYELFNPVLYQVQLIEPENNLTQYKFITHLVVLVSGLAIAPLLILPCLIPSWGERFRKSLLESLLEG